MKYTIIFAYAMLFLVTQTQSCPKNGESAESRIAASDLSKSWYFLYKLLKPSPEYLMSTSIELDMSY